MDNMNEIPRNPLENHPHYKMIKWIATDKKYNVISALDLRNNTEYAIKVTSLIDNTSTRENEIEHLKALGHPNIISFYEEFHFNNNSFMVMELAEMDLARFVEKTNRGRLEESQAREFFCQIIEALEYMHLKNIANRDLKLKNTLVKHVFSEGQCQPHVKLCDFGLSIKVDDGKAYRMVGTPNLMSPEVIRIKLHPNDGYLPKKADIWSCGVMLYYMIEGRFPFVEQNKYMEWKDLYNVVKSLKYNNTKYSSFGAQDLYNKIFQKENKRIDIDGIKEHWWIKRRGKPASTLDPFISSIDRTISHEYDHKKNRSISETCKKNQENLVHLNGLIHSESKHETVISIDDILNDNIFRYLK